MSRLRSQLAACKPTLIDPHAPHLRRSQTIEELEEKQGRCLTAPAEGRDNERLQPHTKMINRGDLNRLVVKSPLPAAVEFERIVFEEVLVQIQVHGYYIAASRQATNIAASETTSIAASQKATARRASTG